MGDGDEWEDVTRVLKFLTMRGSRYCQLVNEYNCCDIERVVVSMTLIFLVFILFYKLSQ